MYKYAKYLKESILFVKVLINFRQSDISKKVF